jgi:hypothetical protein
VSWRHNFAGKRLKRYLVEIEDDVDGCVEDDEERDDEAQNHEIPRVNDIKLISFVTYRG